jgi:hypothetical protein
MSSRKEPLWHVCRSDIILVLTSTVQFVYVMVISNRTQRGATKHDNVYLLTHIAVQETSVCDK